MAENGIYPCGADNDSRYSPEFSHDLNSIEIKVHDNPALSSVCSDVEVMCGHTERLAGQTEDVLADLFSLVGIIDPDVILMPDADTWMPRIQKEAQTHGLTMPFARNGKTGRWMPDPTGVTEELSTKSPPSFRTGVS